MIHIVPVWQELKVYTFINQDSGEYEIEKIEEFWHCEIIETGLNAWTLKDWALFIAGFLFGAIIILAIIIAL